MTVQAESIQRTHDELETLYDAPAFGEVVESSLARADELGDDKSELQLESLVTVARTRLRLTDFIRDGRLDVARQAVPHLDDLIEKIHDSAANTLEKVTLDSDSVTVVNNLGVAADITGDASILDQTLDLLEDTHDLHLEDMKHAMLIAKRGEKLYSDALKEIRSGKTALAAAKVTIATQQRPVLNDGDVLEQYVSLRTVPLLSTERNNLGVVDMSAIEDIQGELRHGFTETKSQAFTEGDSPKVRKMVAQATIQAAMKEFIAHTRSK